MAWSEHCHATAVETEYALSMTRAYVRGNALYHIAAYQLQTQDKELFLLIAWRNVARIATKSGSGRPPRVIMGLLAVRILPTSEPQRASTSSKYAKTDVLFIAGPHVPGFTSVT